MSLVARLESGLAGIFATRRRQRVAAAVGLLLLLLGLCFRLGAAPVARSSEQRCYEVANHMVATGNWLVPVMDGEPRLKKPPLYYWAAAASASAAGGPSPTTLRLPSVLAAVGLLVAVFAWGRSLGGAAGGALSAGCLLMMIQYWTLGRRGVAEMPLALFSTLALFAFDRLYWGRRRELVPWFFGALLLAFLTKATAALLLVGLPVGLRIGIDRSWRGLLRRDVLLWGLACGLGCIAWYVAVLVWVPGAVDVLRESALLPLGMTESVDSAAHVRPVWFFASEILGAAAPAIALAPLVVWHALLRRRQGADPRQGFPLLAFASLFVAFSLIPMKQKHYLMPLLPLLALSIAPALRAAYQQRPRDVRRACGVLGWVLLVGAAPLALLLSLHLAIAQEGVFAIALVCLAVLAAGGLGFAAGRETKPLSLALCVAVVTLTVVAVNHTSFDPLRTRFREDLVQESQGFDARRWEALFERYPLLRSLYRARRWEPRSARADDPTARTGWSPSDEGTSE